MSTILAFHTPGRGFKVPAGETKKVGTVDVSPYSKIRVVAWENVGSPTNVSIRLTLMDGSLLIATLDTLQLKPKSTVLHVIDVPGITLNIYADAVAGTGSDAIGVLIYGN